METTEQYTENGILMEGVYTKTGLVRKRNLHTDGTVSDTQEFDYINANRIAYARKHLIDNIYDVVERYYKFLKASFSANENGRVQNLLNSMSTDPLKVGYYLDQSFPYTDNTPDEKSRQWQGLKPHFESIVDSCNRLSANIDDSRNCCTDQKIRDILATATKISHSIKSASNEIGKFSFKFGIVEGLA